MVIRNTTGPAITLEQARLLMTQTPYTPPKVWQQETKAGGTFASINRPVAGPTHDKVLPVGKHPLQLYSLATPNGVKVTIKIGRAHV